ncbi:MFS transporter [Sphingomonas floccifaciens]|uniref:MFS transporter n=1 Tax=Sphingomonas floccifaciens TaxID=1844115 RepID=A0ABW4NI74_9SPHN
MADSMAKAVSASDGRDDRPMTRTQIVAVACAVLLNALDGFDVLAITFALPGIARAWNVGPAELGVALSSGLVGMAIGSLLLAPQGDRFGRRPLILGCLVIMTLGMGLTVTATNITELCIWRFVTGLGIGGMLAAINAVAAEFSTPRRRDLSIGLMTVGYPAGGLVGGLAVADLVGPYGWQFVFYVGAALTAAFIPLILFGLPESPAFQKRSDGPRQDRKPTANPALALLSGRYRRITIVLVAAYFLHMVTFYFFSGWLPKLMSDMGYATADAIRTSALMSMGGVIGGLVFGWLAPRLGLVRLLIAAMLLTAIGFAVFGMMTSLQGMQLLSFLTGLVLFGGIVGLYALIAQSFPAELRVTGSGLAIGIGRGGAILGPLIGAALIAGGIGAASAVMIIGASAALAAGVLAVGYRENGVG